MTNPQFIPHEDRSAATIAHLSTLIAMVVSAGWLSFVGPLVVWFLYKERSPFARRAAAGAFNFNIGVTVLTIIAWILTLTVVFAVIGIPMLIVLGIVQVVAHALAAMRAHKGQEFNYPGSLRILN